MLTPLGFLPCLVDLHIILPDHNHETAQPPPSGSGSGAGHVVMTDRQDMGVRNHPDLKVKSDRVWLSNQLLDLDHLCSQWRRLQTAYDRY